MADAHNGHHTLTTPSSHHPHSSFTHSSPHRPFSQPDNSLAFLLTSPIQPPRHLHYEYTQAHGQDATTQNNETAQHPNGTSSSSDPIPAPSTPPAPASDMYADEEEEEEEDEEYLPQPESEHDAEESEREMDSEEEAQSDSDDDSAAPITSSSSALPHHPACIDAGLLDWLRAQQHRHVSARTVLSKLLQHYSAPLPSAPLWRMCYQLASMLTRAAHPLPREPSRTRLTHISTLDDVCSLLRTCNNIVVLTGAGVSVSAGIPDFRSRSGIYRKLKDEWGLETPEHMFDLDYFKHNPAMFYTFAKELFPAAYQPTPTHRFIRLLQDQQKLLRNYTQNIDALEHKAGITRVLQCHGSFATASCMSCRRRVDGMELYTDVMAQRVARCNICTPHAQTEESYCVNGVEMDKSAPTFGVLKPNITFFGEQLDASFESCLMQDVEQADLLIVIGSSLKVQPVAGMIGMFPAHTPVLLINREVVGRPHQFDVELLGDCDMVCDHLAKQVGWTLPELENGAMQPPASAEATTTTNSTPIVPPISVTPISTTSPRNNHNATPSYVPPNRYLFVNASQSPTLSSAGSSNGSSDASEQAKRIVSTPPALDLSESDDPLALPNPDATAADADADVASATPLSSPPLPPTSVPTSSSTPTPSLLPPLPSTPLHIKPSTPNSIQPTPSTPNAVHTNASTPNAMHATPSTPMHASHPSPKPSTPRVQASPRLASLIVSSCTSPRFQPSSMANIQSPKLQRNYSDRAFIPPVPPFESAFAEKRLMAAEAATPPAYDRINKRKAGDVMDVEANDGENAGSKRQCTQQEGAVSLLDEHKTP